MDFYPPITESLLNESLTWAKTFTDIQETEQEATMHSRRSLLYDHYINIWEKRDATMQFDVSICAFDGAEICKSVGLYLLSKLKKKLQVDSIGLFRDDALATLRSCSGCMAVRARKNLIKVVQDCGLKITVLTNFTSVNFLDVNIDLTTSLIYKPLKTRFTSTDFRTTPIYY